MEVRERGRIKVWEEGEDIHVSVKVSVCVWVRGGNDGGREGE